MKRSKRKERPGSESGRSKGASVCFHERRGTAHLEDLCVEDKERVCGLVKKLCLNKTKRTREEERAQREKDVLLERIYRLQEQKEVRSVLRVEREEREAEIEAEVQRLSELVEGVPSTNAVSNPYLFLAAMLFPYLAYL